MPYTVGLHAASIAFLSAGFVPQVYVALVVLMLIIMVASSHPCDASSKDDAPISLPIHSLLAIVPFFRRRFDFLNWGFRITGQSMYQFKLLRHTVIILSGESARRDFFTAKHFDLTEGFKILSGAIPMVKGVTSDLQMKRIALIHKRLAAIQRNEPLTQLLPLILEDSRRIMQTWGHSGTFDPFERVYELTFQTTVRSISCSEIANDPVLVARLKGLYDKLDEGTTPATVLLPWIPTPSMIGKLWATKEIYDIVCRAMRQREGSGLEHNDTLQMLLDNKDEKLIVVGFIMGLLIAGARATGTSACWLLILLGAHQDWIPKIREEIQGLLASYSCMSDDASLSQQLSAVPLEAWESSTPVLDSVIRETLRVAQPHTAMRRNLGPETYINGKRIPSGAYIVYPFSDVHLDENIYPDPLRFDPSREHTKVQFGYVGWGAGNTNCLGTRLAKVELKLITSLFILGYDHKIVDASGSVVEQSPQPNWNDILKCRPMKGTCNVQYTRTGVLL